MLNKRKALIGWVVYKLGKPFAKRAMKSRARGAAASRKGAGLIAGVAALFGGLMFWRRRRRSDEGESSES